MKYQTCINVIAKVKGNEYLENLIKGARELAEFSIVDPYDEIQWKERTLMPLLRKEAKEALGEELPINTRVYKMWIQKRSGLHSPSGEIYADARWASVESQNKEDSSL